MAISKEEILSVLRQIGPVVGDGLAEQVLSEPNKFKSYQGLSRAEIAGLMKPVIQAIIEAFQQDDSKPLLTLLDQIFDTRLRAGYDPNVLLAIMDAVLLQCAKAVAEARPNDPEILETIRRRLTIFNNRAKLHLVQLNLSIPLHERTVLDPALTIPARVD